MESSVPFLPDIVLPISFTLHAGEERQISEQRQISLDTQNRNCIGSQPPPQAILCTVFSDIHLMLGLLSPAPDDQEELHQVLFSMEQRGEGTFYCYQVKY